MCGRFTHEYSWAEVHEFLSMEHLKFEGVEKVFEPHFNVVPTHDVLAAKASSIEECEFVSMKWGFLPAWAKDRKSGPINARAETVATQPMFRAAFKARRCVVPISGFYEWQANPGFGKEPWYFSPMTDRMFAIGGIWELGVEGPNFALITTAANDVVKPMHDRMPLILPREQIGTWLFGAIEQARELLVPAPAELVKAHRVSKRVNRPSENGRALIEAVDERVVE